MAGSFCDYLDTMLLDGMFGAATITVPSTMYVGLSTSTIAQAGTGITEPTDASYLRVVVTNTNTTNWENRIAGNIKKNKLAFTFPTFTTASALVTYFFLADDTMSGGGNILLYGQLTNPKTIDVGDTASFAIHDLIITLN